MFNSAKLKHAWKNAPFCSTQLLQLPRSTPVNANKASVHHKYMYVLCEKQSNTDILHNAGTFSIYFRVRKCTLQLHDACVLAKLKAGYRTRLLWMPNYIMVSVWIELLFLNLFITEDEDESVGRLIFDT